MDHEWGCKTALCLACVVAKAKFAYKQLCVSQVLYSIRTALQLVDSQKLNTVAMIYCTVRHVGRRAAEELEKDNP